VSVLKDGIHKTKMTMAFRVEKNENQEIME
jgi:hypothetical protein